MRLFFAIPIPDEYRAKLLAAFPQRNYHGMRFTVAEQLHITVHFLGTTEKEKLPVIIEHANKIAMESSPFEIRFRSFKNIERQNKPVMIWAQMAAEDGFERLCEQFRKAFPTNENKKPNPHITIARIKQLKQVPFELPYLKPFTFKAQTVELFESVTDPEGAVYHVIEKFELGEA